MKVRRLYNVYSAAMILGLLSVVSAAKTTSAGGLGELALCTDGKFPVVARVPIFDLEHTRPEQVTVELASREQLEIAGMAHSQDVLALVVDTDWANPAAPAVQISGCMPMMDEPLNLLLDMRWPTGRLLRQYALPLRALEPEPVTDSQRTSAYSAPANETLLMIPTSAPAQLAMAYNNEAPSNTELRPGTIYLVQPGDTIWSIASRYVSMKPVSARIEDIVAANPAALLNQNVNLLRADAILRMP